MRNEVKDFLRPPKHVSEAILAWLQAENVSHSNIDDAGDWINFSVPVSQAEEMLDTNFHFFRNEYSGVRIIRTLQYSIPQSLHGFVQMIQPTTRFGQSGARIRWKFSPGESKEADYPSELDATFCNTTNNPDCLRSLCGLGDFRATYNECNRLGISGYLRECKCDTFLLFKSSDPVAQMLNMRILAASWKHLHLTQLAQISRLFRSMAASTRKD